MRICEQHENNHFVGGCTQCTYFEYEKYRELYETLKEAVQLDRLARMNAAARRADLDWAISPEGIKDQLRPVDH